MTTDGVFFFIVQRMLSEMSILFLVSDMLQSFIVLQCFESVFESMRTEMGADSALTQ